MRQIEVSRTMVFDAPRRARGFFEALVTDNLDLGRPDSMELIFTGHRVHRGRPVTIEQVYKRKVLTRDTEVTINAFFKHSRIKQYLKDGRALRTETVVNSPTICAANVVCTISMSCRPKPVTSTRDCSILSASGRVVSLRAQPLSGSHSPRSPPRAGGLQPYVSATLGSWPCSAPSASASTPSGSPIGAFVPR